MNLTLCDLETHGNIPSYQFKDIDEAYFFIEDWLDKKDLDKSVFVCFLVFRGLEIEDLRNEVNSILVSHSSDDISFFVQSTFGDPSFFSMDFSIFEFENYQEAFKYCMDLRESF